jgi:hypothetical protein
MTKQLNAKLGTPQSCDVKPSATSQKSPRVFCFIRLSAALCGGGPREGGFRRGVDHGDAQGAMEVKIGETHASTTDRDHRAAFILAASLLSILALN